MKYEYVYMIKGIARFTKEHRRGVKHEPYDLPPFTNVGLQYAYTEKQLATAETVPVFKIGRSKHPHKRLKQIATTGHQKPTNVSKLQLAHMIETDRPDLLEHYFHREYAMSRVWSEWFALTEDDIAGFIMLRRVDYANKDNFVAEVSTDMIHRVESLASIGAPA